METGLVFEVPVQRRYAAGQIRAFEAEIARVRAELQFAEDRVVADVRRAVAGLQTAYEEFDRAAESVRLAEQMQQAEQTNFDLGNSNILFVNLREQATADARLLVVDALESFYYATAEYRAALGIDAGYARPR
jgi:outer membrane protein TolC